MCAVAELDVPRAEYLGAKIINPALNILFHLVAPLQPVITFFCHHLSHLGYQAKTGSSTARLCRMKCSIYLLYSTAYILGVFSSNP